MIFRPAATYTLRERGRDLETQEQPHRRELLAFLAGELSPAERARFDEQLLTDEDFSTAMEQAEFLLLENYADDTLTPAERTTVESLLAQSPEHARQVAITRALRQRARGRVLRWPVRWVLGAAACVLFAVGAALWHLHRQPVGNGAIVARASLPAQINPPNGVNSATATPLPDTILLNAQRMRGTSTAQPTTYRIHPDAPVRLQLLLTGADPAATYTLQLHRSGEPAAAAVHLNGLHLHREPALAYVEATLPPGALPAGQYTGQLRSAEGSYALRFAVENTR